MTKSVSRFQHHSFLHTIILPFFGFVPCFDSLLLTYILTHIYRTNKPR